MGNVRDIWVRVALAASLGMIVYFLAAALLVKFGVIDWKIGFGLMTVQAGPIVLLGVTGLSVLGLLLALLVKPRRGRAIAAAALLIPLLGLGYTTHALSQARAAPPIHDISTDLADPPGFSNAVHEARASMGGNDLDLASKRVPTTDRFPAASGRLFTELQAEGYPDIQPIRVAAASEQAFERSLETARALGWEVTRSDASLGVIEAQTRSFWYGFIDDIAIRVRADGAGGAVIDIRSVSRVGLSDLGANAARIRRFREALEA